MGEERTCPRCGETKPLESGYYHTGRNVSYCKKCHYSESTRRRVLRMYGVTPEEYEVLREGPCASCGNADAGTTYGFHLDHDHSLPGTYRAPLWFGCNIALGALKESPERISQLLAYAAHWKGTP